MIFLHPEEEHLQETNKITWKAQANINHFWVNERDGIAAEITERPNTVTNHKYSQKCFIKFLL